MIFSSCEKDVNGDIFVSQSKIWVNAVVKTNDTVRIFLGTTSGMNSGDIARYRNDATINLFVNNSGVAKKLIYKSIDDKIGYYYYPRLSSAKPGDSLRFEGIIEGTDFGKVEGKTIIPRPAQIDSVYYETEMDYQMNKIKVDLSIVIDTTGIKENHFFILQLQNKKFSGEPSDPATIVEKEDISIKNILVLSYGMYWNEFLHSILIDYSLIKDNVMHISFYVDDKYYKNQLGLTLKTITKDYYYYSKAIDNSEVIQSNIINGSGIFTGYSESSKSVFIK